VAKFAIGRVSTQSLSPPLRRSNRMAAGTIGTRALRTAKPRPCSRSQPALRTPASSPECRAAGQRDGVDAFHRLRRIEQRVFAGARSAAAQVHRGNGGPFEHDGSRPGAEPQILRMAHEDPRTSVMRLRTLWLPSCGCEERDPESAGCRFLTIARGAKRDGRWLWIEAASGRLRMTNDHIIAAAAGWRLHRGNRAA